VIASPTMRAAEVSPSRTKILFPGNGRGGRPASLQGSVASVTTPRTSCFANSGVGTHFGAGPCACRMICDDQLPP
jgi:hypothetical protein